MSFLQRYSKFLVGFAALVAQLLFPSHALAQSDRFWTMWLVEPGEITDEVLTLQEGDVIQATRLVPPALIEITEPLVDPETGNILAEAGAQFFGLMGRHHTRPEPVSHPTYCQITAHSQEVRGLFGSSTRSIRNCLVDEAGDGSLDYTFVEGSCPVAFPMVKGSLRLTSARPIADVPYREMHPRDISETTRVELRFAGFRRRNDDPEVEVVLLDAEGEEREWTNRIEETDLENQWESFGAVFTVLGREGDTIQIRNDVPIQIRPMIMVTTQDSC